MKTYVTITGILFALLTLAHVVRGVQEGRALASSPGFVLSTVVAAAMSVWAFRLVAKSRRA